MVELHSGWLERDGSLRWWGKFRSAEIRPYKDWPGFRAAALERLETTRHVVLKKHRYGIFVFFAQSAHMARSLRKRRVDGMQWAAPYIFFRESAGKLEGTLEVPFEESSDSPARKKFVLWCIQQPGPCAILLNG